LVGAGLVAQRRDGRRIICAVVFGQVEALSEYLLSECCADHGGHAGEGSHD
jgi:hypothetical protein